MADQHMLSDRDRRDIQGLVLFGTTCALLRYHFFRVTDPVAGRRFVSSLTESIDELHVNTAGLRDKDARSESLVYVGFTWQGLAALRVPTVVLNSFPDEFREGAKARASVVGDDGPSAPEQWVFDPDTVHLAVMLYARQPERLAELSSQLLSRATEHRCTLVAMLDGKALPDYDHPTGQRVTKPVHFGYSDGISQPQMLPAPTRHPHAPPAVPPGMFILGHPDSPQDGTSFAVANEPVPLPMQLMRNGTFGAFRMLEQDCDAFEAFLDANAADVNERELLAARLCGRWRNGVPLTLSPDTPHPAQPLASHELNAFDYRPSPTVPEAIDDRHGLRCPVGSHIRRSNPRAADVMGGMGNRLRLIRRGMPYGPPHVRGDGQKRGMLGLFLCVSLKHQFEFISRHWVNDGLFARGLAPADKDPITGAQQPGDTFSYRAPDGTTATTTSLSRFVTTKGSAYLFYPSVTGLRYISQTPERRPTDAERTAVDEAVEVVVAAMTRAIGNGTTRDAHTKHHGIVRATVDIADSLPQELRHGLLREPRSYDAYIRFSNGRPTPTLPPDAAPDVRGMAIKLLGVEGRKESGDEKLTHDFILASHPVFFVPDVFAYVDFLRLPTLDEKLRRFPELGKSFRTFESPLSIRYFSQTPYALGPHRVKYVVQPVVPAEQLPITLTPEQMAARSPNYLREAMAAHLSRSSATFALCIQLAPDDAAAVVDDATRLWESPLQHVATITIPKQEFRSAAQDEFAETISFSPWHCLPEHRPAGTVNLARRRVYREASALRHANRATPISEPDGVKDF